MIPDNCNLPQNARWTDFDDDYTAGEREELRVLKRWWEDGLISDEELVKQIHPSAQSDIDWNGEYARAMYGVFYWHNNGHKVSLVPCSNEHTALRLAWHEAAKEILRGVL